MKNFFAKLQIYKQWVQVVSLLLICLISVIISIITGFDNEKKIKVSRASEKRAEKRQESFAKGVRYYVYKDERPALFLDARELMTNESKRLTMFYYPRGTVYSEDLTPIHYKALSGDYDEGRQILNFRDEVVITTEDSIMEADKMNYDIMGDVVTCVGAVETQTKSKQTGDNVIVKANKVVSNPRAGITRYYTNVDGRISRQREYEEALYFNSNMMLLNLNLSKVDLKGDVYVRKQTLKARSHRGEIFLENYNKKLKYFVLYDDVRIKEEIRIEGAPVVHRKAFAEKLEGIMSENIYILTGFPKVFQDKDVIKGNKITLRENNEVVEIDDVSTNFILE